MIANALQPHHIAPSAATVDALFTHQCVTEMPLVSIPRSEVSVVMRFGPTARNGLDAHVMGTRERAHRKLLPSGVRTVIARLRLGAHEAVVGASASELAGRIVALEDLWGVDAARRLSERAAATTTPADAAAALDAAIAERTRVADGRSDRTRLALEAAQLLTSASVADVAIELGVSERHLRRIFRQALGVGPKTFAKLARFHRALRAARMEPRSSWARIALDAGYYDQAHLSAEFRSIAGATPRALLGELRGAL